MPSIDVAHIREQGQDMILVPLDRSFRYKTETEQDETIDAIQRAATSAGLRGTVVVFWEDSSRRLSFKGPKPWHPYLEGLDMRRILASVNKKISW